MAFQPPPSWFALPCLRQLSQSFLQQHEAAAADPLAQPRWRRPWLQDQPFQAIPYFAYTHGMLDPWFKRTYPLKHLKKWAYRLVFAGAPLPPMPAPTMWLPSLAMGPSLRIPVRVPV
jgi:hypothetical protein